MGENEMKPRPGLPCGVRLTVGFGGAGGTTALALAAETLAELERRDSLSIGVVFTTGSVPEPSQVRHRLVSQTGFVFPAVVLLEPDPEQRGLCAPHVAWYFAAGERPAEGRAATTRLTPSLLYVPAMALATAVAVLYSAELPARSWELNGRPAV